jgi:hypothetical protein
MRREDRHEIQRPTQALVAGVGRAGSQPKRRRLRGFEVLAADASSADQKGSKGRTGVRSSDQHKL